MKNQKKRIVVQKSVSDTRFSTYVSHGQDDIKTIQKGMTAIHEGLGQNIIEKTGISELGRPLYIFMWRSDDMVAGGLAGTIFGGWLYISLLWIEKLFRQKSHGTRLMRIAESEAVKAGCNNIHLDTYSFEAKPFYERHGYEVIVKLDDYPTGHCKYFLKKELISTE